MKTLKLSALVAAGLLAGGMSVTSASAADLGGNCCADLEERIAELEATTARKGNRKVSLTVSGWVAEQITWFDDGEESNTYVSGIGRTLQSNVKFSGSATISPGISAGYLLHLELGTEDSLGLSAAGDDTPTFGDSLGGGVVNDSERGLYTLQSYWWLKSEQLGKVSVGKLSQASDNTAILVDGSGSLVPANWVVFDGISFALRSGNAAVAGLSWADISQCRTLDAGVGGDCNGITENVVRYDSPTFAGFSVSSSWGEDDMWDVAARYAGEHAGFKIAIAASYMENRDESLAVNLGNISARDISGDGDIDAEDLAIINSLGIQRRETEYFQIGAYLQHVATGLFVYGAYGHEESNNIYGVNGAVVDATANPGVVLNAAGVTTLNGVGSLSNDNETWYVKAGIRCRTTSLGHTVFYGEYGQHEDQLSLSAQLAGFTGSEFERYGLGVVQEVDAAAMSLWLAWRHHEGELTGPATGTVGVDEVDIVKFGALINF